MVKVKPNKPNPLFSILVKPRVASRWKSMSRTQLSEVERMKWDKKMTFSKMPNSILGRGNERQNKDDRAKHWGRLQKMRQIHIVNTKHFQKTQTTASSHATPPPLIVTADCSLTALTTVCSTSLPSSPLWLGLSECCRMWCTLQKVMRGLCRRQGKKSGVLKSLQLTLS